MSGISAEGGTYRYSGNDAALFVTVTTATQLRDELIKRDTIIIIDNPELERGFRWLEFWQSKQTTFLIVATLCAALSAYSISRGYKIDASLLRDWKLERIEGKLTLTPPQK